MKEDEKKTKWNSDLFSDNGEPLEVPSNKTENFHTINMIQKIKKIRKAKSRLNDTETFETLSNTATAERFIENMDAMDNTTCKDDPDYEGCDDGDNNGNADDPRQRLINFIENTYKYFDSWFFFIAFIISVALGSSSKTIQSEVDVITKKRVKTSPKKTEKTIQSYKGLTGLDVTGYTYLPEVKDVNIVKKYIGWTTAILISCYSVFHFFFLTFYKDELYIKEGVKLKDITTATMKKTAESSSAYSFETIFLFFFQFAWYFTETFEKYMMVKLPKNAAIYLNASLCFIFLFLFLIYFFHNYPYYFKKGIIDIINMNTNNSAVNLMYLVVVFLFIMDMFNIFNYLPSGLIWYKWTISMILRLIIILFISVPFGGLFVAGYILLYGFFGIFIYNDFTGNVQIFKDIGKYAEDTKNLIRIGTDCSPNTFFEKIMITINVIMDFLYTYIFFLVFIVMLIVSLVDYSTNIGSIPLKNGLILITCTLIIMFSSLCINSFRLKAAGKFSETKVT